MLQLLCVFLSFLVRYHFGLVDVFSLHFCAPIAHFAQHRLGLCSMVWCIWGIRTMQLVWLVRFVWIRGKRVTYKMWHIENRDQISGELALLPILVRKASLFVDLLCFGNPWFLHRRLRLQFNYNWKHDLIRTNGIDTNRLVMHYGIDFLFINVKIVRQPQPCAQS